MAMCAEQEGRLCRVVMKNTFICVEAVCAEDPEDPEDVRHILTLRRCVSCPSIVSTSSEDRHSLVSKDALTQVKRTTSGSSESTTGTEGATSREQSSRGTSGELPSYEEDENLTTLMLKNLPCRLTKDEIKEMIAERGFLEHLKFIYLPVRGAQGLGYAFVGLTSPEIAKEFTEKVWGVTFKSRSSKKVLTVIPAHRKKVPEAKGSQISSASQACSGCYEACDDKMDGVSRKNKVRFDPRFTLAF